MSKKTAVNTDGMTIKFKKFDEMIELSKLKTNRFQRNKHPKDQIERLAKLMKIGVRHAIHISKLSGEVCFGHGRWAAAKLNGWTHYPVVYQDFENEQEEFACVQSDNAIGAWAELDLDAIKTDLLEFPDLDVDLVGIEGLSSVGAHMREKPGDGAGGKGAEKQHIIAVTCHSEKEMQELYTEFQSRGLECKLIT